MDEPISRFFVSQRLRLHYVDWGNPDAPPLVLVHGGRDHCRNWDWVASRLRKDWHVIAPDLRGHGDSQWAPSGAYPMEAYVYDLFQLIRQQDWAPATIVGHSLGGNISVRYTGLYPENVRKLVAIEGLSHAPKIVAERRARPVETRLQTWIAEQSGLAGRQPHRYPSIDDATARMQDANKHLSAEQARHLTRHGVIRNEDGTFSWKFDNYVRLFAPFDMSPEEMERLWSRIACPTLLVYGEESWASNPSADGRAAHFRTAKVAAIPGAGHWAHHDKLEVFMGLLGDFLRE